MFARWTFPQSGFELYGEYGREDHSYDARDLLSEPDHISGYMVGFQKVWRYSDVHFTALRGEVVNTQVSHLVLVRDQSPFYTHALTRQGHTQRGQLLGSPAGYGGAGSILAADYYHPGGRWTVSWTQTLRRDAWLNSPEAPSPSRAPDVIYAFGGEALFFKRRFDVTTGATVVYNLNRNFVSDQFNINALLGVRVGL